MREKIAQITYDGMAWGSHLLQADEILALIIKEIDAVENPHDCKYCQEWVDGACDLQRMGITFTCATLSNKVWFEQAGLAIKERLNG